YTQTDNEGFYSFDVSQGTYRVVEDAQNLFNSPTEGSDPVGYISTTPNWVEVIVDTVNKTADFGDFRGFIVKGFVFDDSGAGIISRANNATRDPGEAGIAGVMVTLTNGSDTYTRYTDQDGLYRFFVSGDPVYPITIRETDLPAYTSTGDHDSDGSASIEERNKITINSNVDSSAFYNFADVKRLLIEGINSVSGLPGSTVSLDHSLLVSTYGSVSLESISSQGFGITAYELDLAGNVLGLWDDNIARSPARYYFRLTVNIPTEAISGTFDTIIVRAVQDWSNSAGSDRAETYDTLTVGAEGLSIRKETRNFSISGGWGLSSEGRPGEIIEYRISFANNGVLPIPSVVITDPLDRDLQLLQNSYSMESAQGNVILSVDGSEHLLVAEDGGDANLDWAFCEGGVLTVNITKIKGALQPGFSGWLIFKSRLRR
ncbi:MAG: SdrD B-like domain-containing protein, partial [Kosmotogaceae bacterium]